MNMETYILIVTNVIVGAFAVYKTWIAGKRQKQIKQLEGHQSLKLAALDKRLEVHQNAWTKWNDLLFNLNDSKALYKAACEASHWFIKNNLYLERSAREAFYWAYLSAISLCDSPESTRKNDRETWEEWRRKVIETGEKIAKAVELPGLGESPEDYAERIEKLPPDET